MANNSESLFSCSGGSQHILVTLFSVRSVMSYIFLVRVTLYSTLGGAFRALLRAACCLKSRTEFGREQLGATAAHSIQHIDCE